jgi:hypothetical protein
MIADMDLLTTIHLIVCVISNLSAFASEALAKRLPTILPAIFIIGSLGVFALTAFARLCINRAIGEQHAVAAYGTALGSISSNQRYYPALSLHRDPIANAETSPSGRLGARTTCCKPGTAAIVAYALRDSW